MRGYRLAKHETKAIAVRKGEAMVVEDGELKPASGAATGPMANPAHVPSGSRGTTSLDKAMDQAAAPSAAPGDVAVTIEDDAAKDNRATKGPGLKGASPLSITTGTTTPGGLTISTGAEIETSKDVKEVKQGCCTIM